MTIQANHVVTISYTLKEHGSTEVVEQVSQEEPFMFLFGSGQLLEAFESQLLGKSSGDTFDFVLSSKDAYGPIDSDAIVKVPIDAFQIDGKFAEHLVKDGQTIRMQDQKGNPLIGKVMGRGLGHVTVDFNHPMAGKDLHFVGEVVHVRMATDDETSHGHVHGRGGVHH
jgi:FKBP-type peptidyl-prolyl cis-trans isomerase SlyD